MFDLIKSLGDLVRKEHASAHAFGNHRGVTRRGLRLALALALAAIAVGPAAVARAGTAPARLPDLAMLPPFDFHIDTTTQPGRRLLRFATVQVNVGPGPFRMYGIDDADGVADHGDILSVVQWIRREDGTWTKRPTTARMSWSGDGHDHWHILDFQRFKLRRQGSNVGNVAKIGFCAFDSYPYTSPKPAFYTGDRDICQTSSKGKVLMGTSRGWGDIYRWNIAFQWIDITDLANGEYKVRVTVDPPFASGGFFRESNQSNNRSWTKVHIGSSKVTVLGQSRSP